MCNNFLLNVSSAEMIWAQLELIHFYSSLDHISAFRFIDDFWYSQKIGSGLIVISVSTFGMS